MILLFINSERLSSEGGDIPFFALGAGFGVSNEGAVYEKHLICAREEEATACMGRVNAVLIDMAA